MNNQKEAAAKAMIEWLSDQRELGHAPDKIICAGEFDLYNLHYYIFKFKKSRFGRWLTGVSGGYREYGTEHCGHVFSEMEPYSPYTAMDYCISMVELIRGYWMDQAVEAGETADPYDREYDDTEQYGIWPDRQTGPNRPGPIGGFVLLSSASWDMDKFNLLLKEEWDLFIPRLQDGAEVYNESGNTFIWKESGMTAAVRLTLSPVPENEAEEKAANNFFWPEAVEVTQTHKAHILIAVLPGRQSAMEAGKLCVKLCSSCSRLDNALGVYTANTVFRPEFYQRAAGGIKSGKLPVLNWIYFGITPSAAGLNGYTCGMEDFGLEELEVTDSQASPQDLYRFLVNMAGRLLRSVDCRG